MFNHLTYEYKILTNVSATSLEGTLNPLAAEDGWVLYELYPEKNMVNWTTFTVVLSRPV